MPLVRVEARRGRTAAQKRALLDATHAALVTALKIPATDRHQRIVEYDPEDFEIPPGHGDGWTLVTITMFAGRSPGAKRELYRVMVDNLAAAGVPPEDVLIVLQEVPLQDWGLRGGQPASEIDLGFTVEV
jgi:phenylpyruvate tautomerase PptA (4-oxalocrotonate tautomerase family)